MTVIQLISRQWPIKGKGKKTISSLKGPNGEVNNNKEMLNLAADFYKDLFGFEEKLDIHLSDHFWDTGEKLTLEKNNILEVEMAADRVRCGYPRVSVFRVSGLGLVFRPRFSSSGLGLVSGSVSGFGFHPWISEINHLELKLMFYNMLIITCLHGLLIFLKVDS